MKNELVQFRNFLLFVLMYPGNLREALLTLLKGHQRMSVRVILKGTTICYVILIYYFIDLKLAWKTSFYCLVRFHLLLYTTAKFWNRAIFELALLPLVSQKGLGNGQISCNFREAMHSFKLNSHCFINYD